MAVNSEDMTYRNMEQLESPEDCCLPVDVIGMVYSMKAEGFSGITDQRTISTGETLTLSD